MKALVLAGGRGSRLQQLSNNQNKCMYEYKGQPLIEYSLENAKSAGVDEIIVVVSYQAESIINRFGNSYKNIPIKYVLQWERKGLVHAIECSQDMLDGEDFLLFLADEVLVTPRHAEMIDYFRQDGIFALCGVVRVENIGQVCKTYAIMYDERNSKIYRLIEKPRNPLNDLMGTGNCVFKNEIIDYIRYTPINQQRDQKELPDLIQCAVDDGKLVKFFYIGENYININSIDDIEQLEKYW